MADPPRVLPALITPFDQHGEIDDEAHRHNLRTLADRGVGGFLLGGSTGEGPYLEPGERRHLATISRDELGERSWLVSGVAAESVRQARGQIAEAADGDADAVLVMTPTTLVRRDPRGARHFYEELAAGSPLSIYLYSVPSVTGYALGAEDSIALAALPGVDGMKDSGADPVQAQAVAAAAPPEFRLFIGSSPALALSIVAGAYGSITASANYAPSLVADVVAASRKGMSKAADAQDRLTGMTRLVETRGVPAIKLAAQVAGLRSGSVRSPLRPLADDEANALRRRLEALKGQLLG